MAKTKPVSQLIQITATQAAVLLAASERPDGVLVRPERLRGKVAATMSDQLIAKALVRELRAKPGLPVWRHDAENGRSYMLVLTKLGRSTISDRRMATVDHADRSSHPATPTPHSSGHVANEQNVDLTSNEAQVPNTGQGSTQTAAQVIAPRPTSKLAAVMTLLGRDAGATIDELIAATGWLPHSTRAALTGIRKRGYSLSRKPRDGAAAAYYIPLAPTARVA